MKREDLLLAMLAAADGDAYEPVQIQKAMFLATRNLGHLVDQGPSFSFEPYDYGPFDKAVYTEAQSLAIVGFAIVGQSDTGRWNHYRASCEGMNRGREILEQLPSEDRNYILKLSSWVRSLSFAKLVRSIYAQFPEMRGNSIFQG